MSYIEKFDVMLGNFPENNFEEQENTSGIDVDLESRGQHNNVNPVGVKFRSFLNTNVSESVKSLLRLQEQLFQKSLSKRHDELRSYLNSHRLEVINSAIEEKVLPSIKNAIEDKDATSNT